MLVHTYIPTHIQTQVYIKFERGPMIVLGQSFINSNGVVPQKRKFIKKVGFLFNDLIATHIIFWYYSFCGLKTDIVRGFLRFVSAQHSNDSIFLRLVHTYRTYKTTLLIFIRPPKRKLSLLGRTISRTLSFSSNFLASL